MIKKISVVIGVSVGAFFYAQDVSVIKNTSEVYGNNYNIGSAKYTAMGGSMGALGGDISVLNTNPAGLGVFITGGAQGTLVITNNKNTSTLAGKSIDYTANSTDLGQVGGVLSFQNNGNTPWKFVNIGINYTNIKAGNYVRTSGNANIKEPYPDAIAPTDYNVYSGHMYDRVGNHSKMNLGVGGNYDNKVYVGASFNFSSANFDQSDDIRIASQNDPTKNAVFHKQNTPYGEVSNGFSMALGVIGKLSNQIRLGAAIETPTWWTIDRGYTYYQSNATGVTSTIYNESRKLSTPTKLTLSGAFVPNKKFAVNIDYRVDLGKPSFSGGDAEIQLNDFYKSTYQAQSEIRLGAEYRLDQFRLRGGYAFTNSPFRDYKYNEVKSGDFKYGGVFNDDGSISTSGTLKNYIVSDSKIVSGGIGYDFKSFFVDAAYQYATYTYTNPFFAGVYATVAANDGINEGTSVVSNVKNTRGNIILTAGWKF
ncbi:MAG: hemin receptor [Cloacibacterium sp.]|nr:hemin receptor [Cloacibacterium sp.]